MTIASRTIRSTVLLAFVSLTVLPLVAQTPAPPGPPAPAGAAAGQAPDQGRGGARGRAAGPGGGAPVAEPDFSPRPPMLPKKVDEAVGTFWLPQGFRLQAVLNEPDIQEPAQIAFDGNGRMYVVELRGYMQDVEATGQMEPVGRISRHEDRNNDGVYETHSVFIDNMIFPRWVTPLGADAVLSKESIADEIWKFTDTNNDGVADKKELFSTGFGRLTNVELAESNLTWALDNWMYSTVNQVRVRWTPRGAIKEPTSFNGAQWGVAQDNYGKIWFQGGGNGLPMAFQFPPVYGAFANPEQYEADLNTTWGAAVVVADVVSGMNGVRMPDGSYSRTTAGAGSDVYRGDRLPADLVGDYFYGDVVGRIVRRIRPVNMEGLTQARNFYPRSEFLKSTDPYFRPTDVTTAPDGTMYVTDMYRGVIQERQWNTPGSYLRSRIAQYALDKVIRHGRIWRVSHVDMPRNTRTPRMLNETPAQLVAHLSHANGWWRDSAQQLIVLKQDKSVVPALRRLAQTSANQLARMHALWTIEGLEALDAALVRSMMKDTDPKIRIQAIRASETLYKGGDRTFAEDYKTLSRDGDTDVVIQSILTLNLLRVADSASVIRAAMGTNPAKGVQLVANTILNPPAANAGGGRGGTGRPDGAAAAFTPEETTVMQRGDTIYKELCFTCHGIDGRGEPVMGSGGETRAPSLAGSPRVTGHRDYVVRVLLHGLTGPIDNQKFGELMIPMGQNPDDWVAAIGSYVRNSFGNRGSFISPADVARIRAATTSRSQPWTVETATAALPRLAVNDGSWQLTASHNASSARNALTFQPWTTDTPQQAGMWLQLDLAKPMRLTEVTFESTPVVPAAAAQGGGRLGGNPGTTPRQPPAAPPGTPVGFPRGYEIQVSMDGTTWSQPVARGEGGAPRTTATFAPVQARYVRITQTASPTDAPPWTVTLLQVYEAAN